MATRTSEKAVTVKELTEQDGRLLVTIALGKRSSEKLKRASGDLQSLLARAVRGALTNVKGEPKRIVAHVPRSLVADFEEYCRSHGTNKSRALLGRISRYVKEDGETPKTGYSNKQRLPVALHLEKKKMIQVVAFAEQSDAFNVFCKSVGIKKDAFFIREMLAMIERETRIGQARNKLTKPEASSTPETGTA